MRVKSLNNDKNDWNQLRNHRMEHYGFSVSNEYYQPSSYFWTREGNTLPITGHYRGASIFLICNGPSLVNGKFDLSLLKRPGVMTYGINNGPRTVRPNFWTCVDDPKRFMKSIWFDPCITKIIPHSFAEKKMFDNEQWADMDMVVGQCPNTVYFHRNEKFMAERFLIEDTVNWGNSGDEGGGRTVMLATLKIIFLLGFRKVYLLGADFNMSETSTYHFDEQRHKGAVNGNLSTYEKLKNVYFPALKPYFEAEGFFVYNCNPESQLKVFDFVDFNDAISEATSKLGDVENERTWGLYSKPEERQKWVNEPEDFQKAHLKKIVNKPNVPIYDYNREITQPAKQEALRPPIRIERIERKQEPIENAEGPEDPEDDMAFGEQEGYRREPIVVPINTPSRPASPFNQKIQRFNSPLAAPVAPHIIKAPIAPVVPTAPIIEAAPRKAIYSGNKVVSKIPCGTLPIRTQMPNDAEVVSPVNKKGYITIPDNGM